MEWQPISVLHEGGRIEIGADSIKGTGDLTNGVMAGPDTPASSKVQASRSVIELSQKSFELEDMELRLARLEKLAGH